MSLDSFRTGSGSRNDVRLRVNLKREIEDEGVYNLGSQTGWSLKPCGARQRKSTFKCPSLYPDSVEFLKHCMISTGL